MGFIPAEFGSLDIFCFELYGIVFSDLSNNHLGGLIPQELGMLQNLLLL
jgi:LRR receptor-like serine/threonine-protein kinase ERECTA